MASVGPQLPPSLGDKRKRDSDEDQNDGQRPSPSPPTRPQSPESAAKRLRTIGPTLPPANIDERPAESPDSEKDDSEKDDSEKDDSEKDDSSDDDDFGPSLPPTGRVSAFGDTETASISTSSLGPQAPVQAKRDEWMTMAPVNGDWSSRVDPTKLKNRKFNTGKGAKGPSQARGGDDSIWHETPEQKVARLQREMMGIKDSKPGRAPAREGDDEKTSESTTKLKEYNEKARGPTLYTAHQKSNPREKEDDPSARAFDREKDIAGGMKINTTQRNELMKKAADFGSRFSSAKYL